MASNLIAMASNLEAMAYHLLLVNEHCHTWDREISQVFVDTDEDGKVCASVQNV